MIDDVGTRLHDDEAAELRRANVGRLDLVLSLSPGEGSKVYVLHARLRPTARSFGRRFREGDALRMLGFTPRPVCRYFPVNCFYGGCYYQVISPAAGDELPTDVAEKFDNTVAGLTPVVEQLVQAAWAAEDAGLPIR